MRFFALITLCLLVGCSGTNTALQASQPNLLSAGWAVGKSYKEVASLGRSPSDRFGAQAKGYGHMIGSARLLNGDLIYRHLSPAGKSSTSRSLGTLGDTTTKRTYRLAYFRVGQDGIVKDYATGSGLASTVACTTYLNGLVSDCDRTETRRLSLTEYDSQVRTSSGAALSSWGAFDRSR